MVTKALRSMRRPATWFLFVSSLILVFALAACGGDSPSSSAAGTNNTNNQNANSSTGKSNNGSASTSNSSAALTISITEPTNNTYVLDKHTIAAKKGDTVTVSNQSDDDLDFDSGDAAKAGVDFIVPGKGSSNVTFNIPGTFVIKSKNGISFTVVVDTASSSSTNGSASMTTIVMTEPKEGAYTFDKPTITVKKGDTVTVSNQSDEDQDFDEGDAAKAGVDFIVPGKGTANVTFNTIGTFVIKSKVGASFSVTVQ